MLRRPGPLPLSQRTSSALIHGTLAAVERFGGWQVRVIDDGGLATLRGADPLLIACNHESNVDPVVVMSRIGERAFRTRLVSDHAAVALAMRPASATTNIWHSLQLTVALRAYQALVVRGELAGQRAVDAMVQVLRAGDSILIFPEGDYTLDGVMLPLKSGVARAALATGVPILPVRLDGTRRTMPSRSETATRRPRITIRFAPPIVPTAGDNVASLLARLTQALAPPEPRAAYQPRTSLPVVDRDSSAR